jgi:hypothetical protein
LIVYERVRVHGYVHLQGHDQVDVLRQRAGFEHGETSSMGFCLPVAWARGVLVPLLLSVYLTIAVNARALVHDQAWPSTCTARQIG